MAETPNPISQLKQRFEASSPRMRMMLGVGAVVVVLAAFGTVLVTRLGPARAYAITGLAAEESQEALAVLRGAGIDAETEAGGEVVTVPKTRLYDARLVLAGAGLPHKATTGFELFDRSDLGVSQFTQQVNLQRALEGELGRTIGSLEEVVSARVHLSLPHKSLFKQKHEGGRASVVMHLHSSASLSRKQLSGIQRLVSSAVPGLEPQEVSLVDGDGSILSGGDESDGSALAEAERSLEARLERQLVSLLEPVVGAGAVIARVSAELDPSEINSTEQVFDPERSALRSERSLVQSQQGASKGAGGVAGAAANAPGGGGGGKSRVLTGNSANTEDETRNFEVSNTVTKTHRRSARVKRLSVAVLVGGRAGKALSAAELAPLTTLARRAVGFDQTRGDQLDVRSLLFGPVAAGAGAAAAEAGEAVEAGTPLWIYVAVGVGGLLLLALVALVLMLKRRKPKPELQFLPAGARVAEIESTLAAAEAGQPALQGAGAAAASAGEGGPENAIPVRDPRTRARELAVADPARAARLLIAWIESDQEEAHRVAS